MSSVLAASFLEQSGLPLAILCALVGLAYAFYLIKAVIASPAGNERMKQIAGAIEEGAKAYLRRQMNSDQHHRCCARGGDLILQGRRHRRRLPDRRGLLAAGGLHRHARGGHRQCPHGAGRDDRAAIGAAAAFNGGAVTGLLVVGLALLSVGSSIC